MIAGLPQDTPVTVLIQLASLVVHAKEATGPNSHQFDSVAIKGIVENPEVNTWLSEFDPALLPLERGE